MCAKRSPSVMGVRVSLVTPYWFGHQFTVLLLLDTHIFKCFVSEYLSYSGGIERDSWPSFDLKMRSKKTSTFLALALSNAVRRRYPTGRNVHRLILEWKLWKGGAMKFEGDWSRSDFAFGGASNTLCDIIALNNYLSYDCACMELLQETSSRVSFSFHL